MLAAPAPAPVATVRGWVEAARAARRAAERAAVDGLAPAASAAPGRSDPAVADSGAGAGTGSGAGAPVDNPYAALASRLRALGPPRTAADAAGLDALAAALAQVTAPPA